MSDQKHRQRNCLPAQQMWAWELRLQTRNILEKCSCSLWSIAGVSRSQRHPEIPSICTRNCNSNLSSEKVETVLESNIDSIVLKQRHPNSVSQDHVEMNLNNSKEGDTLQVTVPVVLGDKDEVLRHFNQMVATFFLSPPEEQWKLSPWGFWF